MKGTTHLQIGIAAGLALSLATGAAAADTAMIVLAAAATSKLPDMDIHSPFAHRGLTHSLLAVMAVAVGSFYFLPYWVALAATIGYTAHIAADMLTVAGCMIFYPLPYRVRLPFTFIRTGGIWEWLLSMGVVGLIALLALEWFR